MEKIKVGIIGPGNIGQDLMVKIGRSKLLELTCVVNIRESEGLERARKLGVDASSLGVDYLIEKYKDEIKIVFDATSAKAHLKSYKKLQDAGMFVIDLTPAAIGPYCVPSVNLNKSLLKEKEVNLVTCAGQATTPLVNAINEVANVYYAEIVSSLSSDSAGAGTRANIDEFTETTKRALEDIGGADEAKTIIILNPANPPIYMSNTIYVRVKDINMDKITDAANKRLNVMKEYVPGVRFKMSPTLKDLNDDIIMLIVEVEGLGDYLPVHSGNLDIINASAVKIAEEKAKEILEV